MTKSETALIKKALFAVAMQEVKLMDSFPEVDLPHSEEYLKSIEAIKCQARINKSKKLSLKKKLLIGLVAAILALLTVCTLAKPVSDLVIEVHEKYISFSYINRDGKDFIYEVYVPEYIPEGYEITYQHIGKLFVDVYISNSSYTITYQQTPLSGNGSIHLDTEGVGYNTMRVDGHTVYYAEKYNTYTLMWENGDYFFKLRCPGTMPLEEIEKIISNIREQPELDSAT